MSDEPDEIESTTTSSTTTTSKAVKGSLAENGIRYFCATVSGDTCKSVIEWILEENLKARFPRLTLIVSSYGGEAYASFALIDAMLGSAIPVDTIGLGYIASAGLLIFMHGANRKLTRNTYVMSHQYSGWNVGKQHELIAQRKEEDWLAERFIEMYLARSKLNREQIKAILLGPSDTFLTAQECIDFGLADEIKLA